MKIAISNIAWDIAEDLPVARLLKQFDVDAIDIAPGKYFPDPSIATEAGIARIRRWWADQGIEIIGMQSLLFGMTGLNIFGEDRSQRAMLSHLRMMCRIGAGLGATRLVFGSPKHRDCSGLRNDQALEQAVGFFQNLGDIAREHGVMVCLEPVPARYGSNFMTDSTETSHVVSAVNHPAIRMQFDTGSLVVNGESPEEVLERSAGLIGHVHASEPGLIPLGDGKTNHRLMHRALRHYLPRHVVSIEMVATKDEPPLHAIERALSCAVDAYRPDGMP